MTNELSRSEWAKSYHERGWSPIPLKFEDKAPESNSWQRQTFSPAQLDTVFTDQKNIGIVLGSPSGNLLDVDLDDEAAVKLAPYFLTQTGTVFGRPGKPNSHFLYRVDEDEILRRKTFFDPDGTLLAEIRGEGHQTMVPSSVHPSGEQLEWSIFEETALTTTEKLEIRVGFVSAAAMIGRHWNEWDSRRHIITLHLAGGLLRAGLNVDNVREFVRAICVIGGEDDWEDRDKAVQSTFEKMEAGEDITGFPKLTEVIGSQFVGRIIEWLKITTAADRIPNTDHGNGIRFANAFDTALKYVPDWGNWILWDSSRWKQDKAERVFGYARQVPGLILEEALKEGDEDKKNALLKWSMRSQDVGRLNAILRVAKTDERFLLDSEELDADPWLFNVQNGTINLRTGGLQAHDPRDRISRIANIPYDPDAKAPLWEETLLTIQNGNVEMVDFLQRLVGYSMTGLTTEQVFVLMWGPPGTGKSTFNETIRTVFGDYATNAEAEVFMARQQTGRANPEVARLQGARLVTSSETEENKKLAIARIKLMTGGDRVTASNLYAAPFEFEPIMKLWLATNHKPRVPADEGGVWDRMVFVPFTRDMRNDPNRIKDLKEQLRREMPGILTWAVEGCLKWRANGLGRPPEVEDAQNEYRSDSDEIAQFLEEMTETGDEDDFKVASSTLYATYKEWAKEGGYYPLNVRRFKEKLEMRGLHTKRTTAGMVWLGLKLHAVDPDVIDLNAARPNPFGRPGRTG